MKIVLADAASATDDDPGNGITPFVHPLVTYFGRRARRMTRRLAPKSASRTRSACILGSPRTRRTDPLRRTSASPSRSDQTMDAQFRGSASIGAQRKRRARRTPGLPFGRKLLGSRTAAVFDAQDVTEQFEQIVDGRLGPDGR